MSDSGDEDDANLPSAAECDRRCKEFAEITGTDTALAMFFLQDRQWSLEVGYCLAVAACSYACTLKVCIRVHL